MGVFLQKSVFSNICADFEIELYRNGASQLGNAGDQKDVAITILCNGEDCIGKAQSVCFTEIVIQMGGHPEK